MTANDERHGLPEQLPAGERMLWQGRPQWWSLCVQALHVRKVAIYFGLLMLWSVLSAWHDGATPAAAAASAGSLVIPAAIAIAILLMIGFFMARTTLYTITTRRVVMQFGVALPMTLNIPLRQIGAAALKMHRDGSGAIPLATAGHVRLAYLMLWPHVRPWRLTRTEPMLRALAEPQRVASILTQALTGTSGEPAAATGAAAGASHKQGKLETTAPLAGAAA